MSCSHDFDGGAKSAYAKLGGYAPRAKRFVLFARTLFFALFALWGEVHAATCPNYSSNQGFHTDASIGAAYAHCVSSSVPVIRMSVGGFVYGQFVGCESDPTYGFLPRYEEFMTQVQSGCVQSSGHVEYPTWHFWSAQCSAGTAWDQASGTCAPVNLAKNLGPTCAVGVDCGNPIRVTVGNKYQQEADLHVSRHLEFVRHYNSLASRVGSLGPKWSHNYDRRVSYTGGEVPVAVLTRPGGSEVTFQWLEGEWRADADVAGKLLRTLDANGSFSGWTYAARDAREEERFDTRGRLIEIYEVDHSVASFEYNNGVTANNDDDFLLTGVQALDGRKMSIEYDTLRRVSTVTDPAGSTYQYQYDTVGRLSAVTYPGGAQRKYLYNELGYTSNVSQPNALTGIAGEDNQRFAIFRFDASGRAIATEHAGGVEKFSVTYKPDNSAVVTTPLGATETRNFTTIFGVRKASKVVSQCSGCATQNVSYTYDVNGYPDQVTDARGMVVNNDYNPRGLVTQRVDAATDAAGNKRTTQTDWHLTFAVPTERRTYSAAGTLVAKQAWTYNTRGQTLTASSIDTVTSASRTTTTTYCEQPGVTAGTCPLVGLVTSVNGTRTDVNDITTFTYYPGDDASCATAPTTCPHRQGDLWMVQDALGNVTETLKYDGAGRVLSVKDANSVVTDFEYHPRGWLTARKVRGSDNAVETDDQITRIEYYPTGLVKKTTLPDGSYTSFTYDAAHRLTDITDGEGNKVHYTLDNAGNRTKEDTKDSVGALVRTLSRVYNQLGQLQTHKDAYNHATGYVYDANGNTDTITDALSRVTDNAYDPLNRLTQTIQNVGGLNVTTQFHYDARDNLTAVIDPKGLTTGYTYNSLGDLTQLSSPDTGVTAYTYDSAGNRASQTDARNVTATYGYDVLNRQTSVSYPDTSLNVGYSYDTVATACTTGETFAVGRLSQITDGSGSTQYCYDRFGNMVRKVQTTNGQALTVRYAYTQAGQVSSVTYPDGTVADYVRDTLGRTTEVGVTRPGQTRQVLLTSASYHPFGPVAEWVFGNGRLFQRTLNQNYQPGVVQDQSAGGLSVGYEFDAVGNLSKLRNGDQNDPPLRIYGYDALNRLTSAQDGTTQAFTEGYTYDATGNRTSATVGSTTTAYTYPTTSHRLTDVGGVVRTYDNVGNTTAIGGTTREFVYSDANRMSAVKQNGVTAMSYAYNGMGEQVGRNSTATDIIATYDESGHWLGEYGNGGVPTQQMVWLDDLPVGLIVGPSAANQPLHYIEADALGTPRMVIESQRNVAVWSWPLSGEAFGANQSIEDVDGDGTSLVFSLRFPGQRYDASTQLNYNYFRDYDSGAGRYIESDPIGHDGGPGTYLYAEDNSLTRIDPEGLQAGTIARYELTVAGGAMPGDRDLGLPEPDVAGLIDRANFLWVRLPADVLEFGGLLSMCVYQSAPPTKAECSKAQKLLKQVFRLAKDRGVRLTPQREEELRRKINNGTITSDDLPATIQREFPQRLRGLPLAEIERICKQVR